MVFSKSLEWKMAHSEECEALNLLLAALRTKSFYEAQRNQARVEFTSTLSVRLWIQHIFFFISIRWMSLSLNIINHCCFI